MRGDGDGYILLGEFSAAFEGSRCNVEAEVGGERVVEEVSSHRAVGSLLWWEELRGWKIWVIVRVGGWRHHEGSRVVRRVRRGGVVSC